MLAFYVSALIGWYFLWSRQVFQRVLFCSWIWNRYLRSGISGAVAEIISFVLEDFEREFVRSTKTQASYFTLTFLDRRGWAGSYFFKTPLMHFSALDRYMISGSAIMYHCVKIEEVNLNNILQAMMMRLLCKNEQRHTKSNVSSNIHLLKPLCNWQWYCEWLDSLASFLGIQLSSKVPRISNFLPVINDALLSDCESNKNWRNADIFYI